jgi:hypothetical protein
MKILLGDNQFFGINHADLKKALETQQKFSTKEKITSFIIKSLNIGLDGFMINSNKLGYDVVQEYPFQINPKVECHYSIPYPHKYASMVNEAGVLSLLSFIIKNIRFTDLLNVIRFIYSSNVIFLLPIIVRLETPKALPKGSVIYLQNIITDLVLGLNNGNKIIERFIETVESLGYKAGIITLNPRHFRTKLIKSSGNKDLYLCFNINKSGFNVFPSVNEVQEEIKFIKANTKWNLVGMSIFSSGSTRFTIPESIDYIKSLPLDYVVFGSSNLTNIESNLNLFICENN